ncbi:hypothetical protein [Candidatus Pristimantibacillus sp. PTI5]|uniref:hypothetical protein n=1 Tax=Candidatus Pristimantibacillus sp. PTI5 TaxID=3400422 RepID=UPI003B0250F7
MSISDRNKLTASPVLPQLKLERSAAAVDLYDSAAMLFRLIKKSRAGIAILFGFEIITLRNFIFYYFAFLHEPV